MYREGVFRQGLKALLLVVPMLLIGCNDDDAPLADGGFETPRASAEYDVYAPGSYIGPWEVHDGKVDLVGKYWKAAAGAQSLNLQGGPNNHGAWISRELTTKAGRMYQLRFAMSGNPDNGPGVKKMEVWWGDTLVDTPAFEVTGDQTHEQMGWKTLTYKVSAKANKTRLKFLAAVDEPWGPVIDSVSVKSVDQ